MSADSTGSTQGRRGDRPPGSAEAFSSGISPTPRRAWLAAGLYTAVLYSTLQPAYNAYVWLFDRIGLSTMSLLLNTAYVAAGAAVLVFLAFRIPWNTRSLVALILIGSAAALNLRLENIPANRLHLLQYTPVAVLVLDALRFHWRGWRLYALSLALSFLVGCGDEYLQSLLPDRRFDPWDLVLNLVAAFLALAFVKFVVGEENYPWGRRR